MSTQTYYKAHEACPKCGSDSVEATCIGTIYQEGRPFKDSNKATCVDCKWVGIVHDLVVQEK